jgi:hypothetical protein
MADTSCLDCPTDVLAKLMIVQETHVSAAAARLLVLSGADGEQEMIKTLGQVRGSFRLALCLNQLALGSGPLDADALAAYVNHNDKYLRTCTIEILALRGDASCTEHLLAPLNRRDSVSREAALTALVAVGDDRAVDAVLEQLRTDATRRSRPDSVLVELELNYLAQHFSTRPDALEHARAIIVENWSKRDEAEVGWIRMFLPQAAPDAPEPISSPSERALPEMRQRVVGKLRQKIDNALMP